MNIESEITAFEELTTVDKATLLARLVHELTLEARTTYGQGVEQVKDPARLRIINEIQYRISGFLVQLMCDDFERHSDDAFLRLILGNRPNKALQQLLHNSWRRAVAEDRTIW